MKNMKRLITEGLFGFTLSIIVGIVIWCSAATR